jgi:hypothetical protein
MTQGTETHAPRSDRVDKYQRSGVVFAFVRCQPVSQASRRSATRSTQRRVLFMQVMLCQQAQPFLADEPGDELAL